MRKQCSLARAVDSCVEPLRMTARLMKSCFLKPLEPIFGPKTNKKPCCV